MALILKELRLLGDLRRTGSDNGDSLDTDLRTPQWNINGEENAERRILTHLTNLSKLFAPITTSNKAILYYCGGSIQGGGIFFKPQEMMSVTSFKNFCTHIHTPRIELLLKHQTFLIPMSASLAKLNSMRPESVQLEDFGQSYKHGFLMVRTHFLVILTKSSLWCIKELYNHLDILFFYVPVVRSI